MTAVAQRSFAGGEVAPAIYPRCDTVKYTTGARQIRNCMVKKHGGASNRPGTSFVCEVKDSSKLARLIPFRHTEDLTFVLELGDLSVRGVQSGGQIRKNSQSITGITNANPCVVTYSGADNYSNGDEINISGVLGAIGQYLNGRNFLVASVNTATNTFNLAYLDGTLVNSTSFGAYGSAGTIEEVHEITDTTEGGASLYTEDELFDLQYAQNAEILSLAHSAHPVRELVATALTTWSNQQAALGPAIANGPDTALGTAGAAGSKTFKFKITAVDEENFEESLANTKEGSVSISSATKANPCVVTTATNHGYATGDSVFVSKLDWINLNVPDAYYTVTVLSATTFSIVYNTSAASGSLLAGGTCYRDIITIHSAADGTSAAPNVLTWSAVTGAREYNVYKEKQGLYCYHGTTSNTNYNDEGGNGDPLDNPPENRPDVDDYTTPDADTYPSVVGSIQQRRVFANTADQPQAGWASKTALPNNFTLHFPLNDDDSVKFKLAGERNSIRHVLDLGDIVVLTAGGEWVLQGDNGFLTPTQINPKQVGYNGSSKLKPVLLNNNALYVQAEENIVRDLAFDFSVDGYKGNDLTIFSSHLFENYTIVDWAYQKTPNSIVWAVRSDGTLLGLTYIREQDILAWHRHDLDGGVVESVATVKEGTEDALYLLVKRTINGSEKRYIERLNTRVFDDLEDLVLVDCARTYDGRHTGTTTMTLSGGTTWKYDETITITASAATFTSYDVGKEVHLVLEDEDGNREIIRFTLNEYTSSTVMTGRPHKTVPTDMRSVAIGNGSGTWGLAVKIIDELWHLEGEAVSVQGDGGVVASVYNPAYSAKTVSNGRITLDRAYVVIHVGLPVTADIETLNIDTVQGETLSNKKLLPTEFTAWFEKTRGVFCGPKPPTDDSVNPLENLYEIPWRENEDPDERTELFTGTKTNLILGNWNSQGRVFIRQVDPIPMTLSAIAPTGFVPYKTAGG